MKTTNKYNNELTKTIIYVYKISLIHWQNLHYIHHVAMHEVKEFHQLASWGLQKEIFFYCLQDNTMIYLQSSHCNLFCKNPVD